MSIVLRIILIAMSFVTCGWVLLRIRKSQVKIEDSVFWFLLSAILVVIGLFPQIMIYGARLIGVQSPVNLVYLIMLFVLIVKLFHINVRISQIESKLQTFVQRYAIDINSVQTQEEQKEFADSGAKGEAK